MSHQLHTVLLKKQSATWFRPDGLLAPTRPTPRDQPDNYNVVVAISVIIQGGMYLFL